jgi:hypothetical protein
MKRTLLILIPLYLLGSCSQPEKAADITVLTGGGTDTVLDTTRYQPVPPVESFDNVKLRVELEEIYNSDQGIRNKYLALEKEYGHDSKEVKALMTDWRRIDSMNCIKVTAILDKYGWLATYEVGEQGNSTLFLVIQHADLNIQDKYLPKMRKAVREHKAEARELALLEDRVLLGHGKKQLFGSQVEMDAATGKYKLSPIEDEPNVNKRRAAVGLEPLEEYVKHWDIHYTLPKN